MTLPDSILCAPFDVEVVGRFGLDEVGTSFVDEPRPTTPEIEQAIECAWQVEFQDARRTNRILYDGDLGRLVRATIHGSTLHLLLARTTYREFIGTNVRNRELVRKEPENCFADPVGVSSLVITGDGFIVLGRRGMRVALHGGYLHAFGGMLEAADRQPDGTYDVFVSARRELVEEFPLTEPQIDSLTLIALVRDRTIHQPELIFAARSGVTWEAMETKFVGRIPRGARAEHTALEVCREEPDALIEYLRKSTPVAPVAQAAVLLHGWQMFGSEWLDVAVNRLYSE